MNISELPHTKGYHKFQRKLEYISLSLFTIISIITFVFFPQRTHLLLFPILFGGMYAISFIMKIFIRGPIEYDMTLIFPELSMSLSMGEELTKSVRKDEKSIDISELKDELARLKKEIELLKR